MHPNHTLLAIDTTTSQLCVSLYHQYHLFQYCHPCEKYANALTICVQKLLQYAQIMRHQLTHIIVNTGPGPFTSLRVGIASAQGLAHALNIPVCTITNSRILAFSVEKIDTSGHIACLTDAKLGQVYFAVLQYQPHTLPTLVYPDVVLSPQDLPSITPYTNLSRCGSGWQTYQEQFSPKWLRLRSAVNPLATMPANTLFLPLQIASPSNPLPKGASIATVMLLMCLQPSVNNPILPTPSAQITPNYVRHQVAQKPKKST